MQPSYVGHVATALDAAVLFKACLQGYLPIIGHRVGSSDRARLISSGHIFIYEQQEGNIQRWTDGLKWSPSRVLDEFLVYRELDGPMAEGRKKRTKPERKSTPEPWERLLYGSFTGSYDFKLGGLVKKTVAVRLESSTLRLVSYYRAAEVLGGTLRTPSADPDLSWMAPRAEVCFAATDRFHGSRSPYLLRANTSTATYRDTRDQALSTQEQALDTQDEIFHWFPCHRQNPCAGYCAAWHELGHCP